MTGTVRETVSNVDMWRLIAVHPKAIQSTHISFTQNPQPKQLYINEKSKPSTFPQALLLQPMIQKNSRGRT